MRRARNAMGRPSMHHGTTRRGLDGHTAVYSAISIAAAGILLYATDVVTTITIMAICAMFSAALAMCAHSVAMRSSLVFAWSLAILSGGGSLAFLSSTLLHP